MRTLASTEERLRKIEKRPNVFKDTLRRRKTSIEEHTLDICHNLRRWHENVTILE